MSSPEDPDIALIKARKMKELREKAAAQEKANAAKAAAPAKKTSREIVLAFLHSRGDEVLGLAYAQFPAQTEAIVAKIAQLIRSGELTEKISGGELLSLFRSVGLRVRLDTTISVEDDGKFIPLSEKLKQGD